MKKIALKIVGLTVLASALTGCIGSNAVTGKVMKFNVEVVDNRYARSGVNFLLAACIRYYNRCRLRGIQLT